MLNQNIILSDVFTSKEVDAIMRRDAQLIARPSDVPAYLSSNRDKYRVLLNTWVYMCTQYVSPRNVSALVNMIRRDGLLSVIDRCSGLASDIIRSDFTLDDLGDLGFLMNEDPRITLQLLRYPKRFSPSGATLLSETSLKAFEGLNFSLRGQAVRISHDGRVLERAIHYPSYLIDRVSYWCASCLAFRHIDDLDPLMEGRFSSGVTANGSKTLYEKYVEWCKLTPCYKDYTYPLPRFGNHYSGDVDDIDYVRAVSVPKNYKTTRIIAEVSAKCQYHQQGIRQMAIDAISQGWAKDYIKLDDQTINQEWSRLGSIYGTYATIDLSSASDSISTSLAKQILPDDWFRIIDLYNPPNIKLGNKVVKRNIFLTSGSGDTFVFESIIFMAIAMTAWEYVTCYSPESKILYPRVYGDDLICDTRCFDTLVDFLGKLGFTVNVDKSFTDGMYRESCGAEWFCGLDTTTKYFPRKAFDETSPEYIMGLISLQHRLYEYESCEQWLTHHVRDLYRKCTKKELTSSLPGTECEDLWEQYPFFHTVYPPYDHNAADAEKTRQLLDQYEIKRECHSTLKRRTLDSKALPKRFQETYHRVLTWEQLQIMEMFRYVDFLQHGTPTDEWGLPIHRQAVSDDLLIPELIWTTQKR